MGEAAFGVADLPVHELRMDFGLALHGVDDVGWAEAYVDVVGIVTMEQAAFVCGDGDAQDADEGVLENFVVVQFVVDGDGGWCLGVEGEGRGENRRAEREDRNDGCAGGASRKISRLVSTGKAASREALEDAGCAHAASDAHGDHAVAGVFALQVADDGGG